MESSSYEGLHNSIADRKRQSTEGSRLNVVYIHTHDTGRMIGPYESVYETPALNRLAAMGTVLDHLYCVGPTCSPSRSGLLTGRMPHQNGMLGLAHRGFSLENMDQHLCRFLKRNGYETYLCGMQHESHDPMLLGYDHVSISRRLEADDLSAWDNENADAACEYIKHKHEKPFFLSYGLVQTHRPFLELDEDLDPEFVNVPAPLPSSAETREDMARFMTSVRRADACIERVLAAIEKQGLLERTVIFYTTDHGAAFPFMKCTLSEAGTGVAGIIYLPGGARAGGRIQALLSHLDFYPTLCELLSLDLPSWLEGNSFASLIRDTVMSDNADAINSAIFSEINYHAAYEPQRSIRTDRFRLIMRYSDLRKNSPDQYFPADKPRLANIDAGLSKDYLSNSGLISSDGYIDQTELLKRLSVSMNYSLNYRFRYAEMLLFDQDSDPHELCNLAANPKYEYILNELRDKLFAWQLRTNDPLIELGFIPRPEAAVVNRQSSNDPDSNDANDYE